MAPQSDPGLWDENEIVLSPLPGQPMRKTWRVTAADGRRVDVAHVGRSLPIESRPQLVRLVAYKPGKKYFADDDGGRFPEAPETAKTIDRLVREGSADAWPMTMGADGPYDSPGLALPNPFYESPRSAKRRSVTGLAHGNKLDGALVVFREDVIEQLGKAAWADNSYLDVVADDVKRINAWCQGRAVELQVYDAGGEATDRAIRFAGGYRANRLDAPPETILRDAAEVLCGRRFDSERDARESLGLITATQEPANEVEFVVSARDGRIVEFGRGPAAPMPKAEDSLVTPVPCRQGRSYGGPAPQPEFEWSTAWLELRTLAEDGERLVWPFAEAHGGMVLPPVDLCESVDYPDSGWSPDWPPHGPPDGVFVAKPIDIFPWPHDVFDQERRVIDDMRDWSKWVAAHTGEFNVYAADGRFCGREYRRGDLSQRPLSSQAGPPENLCRHVAEILEPGTSWASEDEAKESLGLQVLTDYEARQQMRNAWQQKTLPGAAPDNSGSPSP